MENRLIVTPMIIDNFEALTYEQFIENYHKGLTKPALNNARKQNVIDTKKIGNLNMVLLTVKTLAYRPNNSLKRLKKIIKINK